MKTLAILSVVLFALLPVVSGSRHKNVRFPEECGWMGGKCQVARCLPNWKEIGRCSNQVPCCARNTFGDGRIQFGDNIY